MGERVLGGLSGLSLIVQQHSTTWQTHLAWGKFIYEMLYAEEVVTDEYTRARQNLVGHMSVGYRCVSLITRLECLVIGTCIIP